MASTIAGKGSDIQDKALTSALEPPTMSLMLSLTIPVEGIMALRTALGEELSLIHI